MFSKSVREPTKRRITPECIQPVYSSIDEDIVESSPLPTDNEKEEKKEADETECVICYESLNATKNFCVTECGHKFCFSCMMKHAQRSNGCPLCRAAMIEDMYDSETEFDIEGSDDDETIEESVDESYPEYEIEKFVEAFEAKGYGLKEALSLLMNKFSKTDDKYTFTYINKLETDVEDICEELQNECEEREEMESEDKRA
jgi:hypothetical protein